MQLLTDLSLQTTYKIENRDVKEADAGEWKAVVKNRIGEKTLPCNLTVIRKILKL